MNTPERLFSIIYPEQDVVLDKYDKHSKYLVRIIAPNDISSEFYSYAKKFKYAAHLITAYLLEADNHNIGQLDTYFFSLAFLYRHSIELGLKAIGFKYIHDIDERKGVVKDTFHDLFHILLAVEKVASYLRPNDELEWLQQYFADISVMDKESDSFRYPFHIYWKEDEWGIHGEFEIKRVFERQTHIDLVKFANKFEAAFEIIEKWYIQDENLAEAWNELLPKFIEEGGYYYGQSVVGYGYNREDYYPYTKAYLETANYLKWYMKNETDAGNEDIKELLFMPMCYLYRNCVELSLKTIWFEEIGENFQNRCKVLLDRKHSISGMWNEINSFVLEFEQSEEDKEYLNIIGDYCRQVHNIDTDASKFRYPVSKNMEYYFKSNKRFDFIHVGDFFEAVNNALDGLDASLNHMNECKAEMEAEYRAVMGEEYWANIDDFY